jgi:hypothetical protein
MQKVYALGALLRSNEMAGQKTGVDWSIDGVNSPVRSIEHTRDGTKKPLAMVCERPGDGQLMR